MEKSARDYIKYIKRVTVAQAAKELGYSTEHLFRVLSGKLPASQKLKDKFAKWTNGEYYL